MVGFRLALLCLPTKREALGVIIGHTETHSTAFEGCALGYCAGRGVRLWCSSWPPVLPSRPLKGTTGCLDPSVQGGGTSPRSQNNRMGACASAPVRGAHFQPPLGPYLVQWASLTHHLPTHGCACQPQEHAVGLQQEVQLDGSHPPEWVQSQCPAGPSAPRDMSSDINLTRFIDEQPCIHSRQDPWASEHRQASCLSIIQTFNRKPALGMHA